MRFVADESVDSAIVERLRRDGHEGLYIAETQPGISDEAVLELANRMPHRVVHAEVVADLPDSIRC